MMMMINGLIVNIWLIYGLKLIIWFYWDNHGTINGFDG